ncbi:hypothetical protein IGI04_030361 [Brassica rapa subsp. trilocularis]|uniref:Uncharacterized protein n=1 Tax=Brassica rapa subsp. trilocularis TaxID=1813537 RepID=A0ABQ7LS27_BRACM|nr:hypothetical protein IGI04_030361 [Brassica rapa subsp. trilocularis]
MIQVKSGMIFLKPGMIFLKFGMIQVKSGMIQVKSGFAISLGLSSWPGETSFSSDSSSIWSRIWTKLQSGRSRVEPIDGPVDLPDLIGRMNLSWDVWNVLIGLVYGLGHITLLPSKKWKTSDKEKPSIFPNMEEFNLMKPNSRRLYKSYNSPQARDRLLQGLETRTRWLELGFLLNTL